MTKKKKAAKIQPIKKHPLPLRPRRLSYQIGLSGEGKRGKTLAFDSAPMPVDFYARQVITCSTEGSLIGDGVSYGHALLENILIDGEVTHDMGIDSNLLAAMPDALWPCARKKEHRVDDLLIKKGSVVTAWVRFSRKCKWTGAITGFVVEEKSSLSPQREMLMKYSRKG